jgi:hypothetical protein
VVQADDRAVRDVRKRRRCTGRVQRVRLGSSGNKASIVVVRTDAGYSTNPGHPGTGTVVAKFC